MAINIGLGEEFLRDVAKATLTDLAKQIIPGSSIAEVLIDYIGTPFCVAAWDWLKGKTPIVKQQAFDALMRVPFSKSSEIVSNELSEFNFSSNDKAALVSYLAAVPMSVQKAVSRPNDDGVPTTLLSQLPKGASDLLRFLPKRPPHFHPGQQVEGHDYRVQTLLGQGGFAEVWKAEHLFRPSQPPVALKFCLDSTLVKSLETEIRLLDKLDEHHNSEDFVQLLDTAYSATPPFLVYEYVDGGDLVNWLAGFDGQPPSEDDVLRVLKMTARPLAFAHNQGVIHRDLKPSNILITRKGRIKISDFGIGAFMADADSTSIQNSNVVNATVLQGAHTPMYTDPAKDQDELPHPKDDIYALGIIAYQLLVGDVTRRIGPYWRSELEDKLVSPNLLNIVELCVTTPSKRFSNGQILLNSLGPMQYDKESEMRGANSNDLILDTYCTNCGNKADSDDRYCIGCGKPLI